MSVIAQHLTSILSALPTDASALDSSISALKSSISALESSIKNLDDSSSCWERLVPWFTGMVVIGVAAEVWVIWSDFSEDLAAWRRGIVRPPDRPSSGKFWVGVIATILVAVGVLGELGIGVAIARINAQLRTKNADLRGYSDQLVAISTQRAADADLKRVELQKRIVEIFGERQLTPEQSSRIVKRLSGLKGVKVDVFVPALASPYNPTEVSESINAGLTVVHTLRSAHIDAEGWLVESCQNLGAANLVFEVGDDDPAPRQSIDRAIASKMIDAFAPEIGTWPKIELSYIRHLACTNFSSLEGKGGAKRRQHNAAISIIIGIKTSPILTLEMLEPSKERADPCAKP